MQCSLFSSSPVTDTTGKPALMSVLDGLNQRHGRSTITAASSFVPDDGESRFSERSVAWPSVKISYGAHLAFLSLILH